MKTYIGNITYQGERLSREALKGKALEGPRIDDIWRQALARLKRA